MSNEYTKGVLDAKLAELLTDSDFNVFNNLNEADKLTFFINHNLVKTPLVSNFEAMCSYVLSDLKAEISEYLGAKHLYLNYFFSHNEGKDKSSTTVEQFNEIYELALVKNDQWFVLFLDLNHAILNLLTILRGKSLGKSSEEINGYYLRQNFISDEVFSSLINGERSSVLAHIKTIFNFDVEANITNQEVEEILDRYLHEKLKEFAYETDLEPTLIYYIKMKQYEVFKLRSIYYTKEETHG